MMRRTLLALGLLGGCAGAEPCAEPVETAPPGTGDSPIAFHGLRPTNLLMISIDTLRKDHVGAHGDLGLTPFLDQWAEAGVVMTDHRPCANWTMASGTCTLHGRYDVEIGHIPRLNDHNGPVPEGSPTLASALGEAGYYTALFSGNAFMSPEWGSAAGYAEWSLAGNGLDVGQRGVDALRAAVASGRADRGWFLHLHYMEPHQPYQPAEQYLEGVDELEPWPVPLTQVEHVNAVKEDWDALSPAEQDLFLAHVGALYRAEVRTVDARIQWTVEQLEAAGLIDDRTLVVVWTDHGEQFFEHGYLTHAYELQYGENDGVLFFWSPTILPARVDLPTHAIDLAPTVLDLLGVPIPPEMTGHPIGRAPVDRVRMADAVARAGVVQSASRDGLKLHYNWDGTARLYDRAADPLEMRDLFDPQDPRVEPLWCAICAYRPRLDALVGREPTDPRGLRCP